MKTIVDNRSIKILLLEDSPTDARLLMAELKGISDPCFEVVWVERTADAVLELQRQSFDVGLLDLSLPDSSGMATYFKIQRTCPALPVVVLTGAADEALGVEAIRIGVQDYIVKGSADGRSIARSIRYAFERKCAEEALRQSDAKYRQVADELEKQVVAIRTVNDALLESQNAALNLMEDALEARMQAEKVNAELLRSREEWIETFNVIPDHIAIIDNNHRIIRANKAMAQKLGFSPTEVEGKSCHLCVHGSKTPIAACPHSLLLKDGNQHIAEIYEETLGGNFLVSVSPIFSDQGTIKGSVHVARDITEQIKREKELNKLNRTLEALSKSSQAMTRTSDEQEFLDIVCKIVVNDCGYAMVWIGYAQDDEAKSIRPVAFAGFEDGYLDTLNLSWADNENGRGPTGTAIRTGTISQCRNMQTDPAFSPWRESAIKQGYESSICIPLTMLGNPFGAITIYSREPDAFSDSELRLLGDLANDLAYGITTIRLRAAQAKSEETLRNEHNFITTILQTTGGLIVGFDLQGRIKIFNHACERATGYLFNDVKDRVFWEFLLVDREIESVKETFNKMVSVPVQNEYENYWVTKNGTNRFIRWTNSAVVDKKGNVELVIGTGIDITERKQAEIELEQYKTDLERLVRERTAALRASEDQLAKANEMKLLGQLTSGVAHEVRNPLNGIIAIMGALSKELSDSEHFEPYVKHMRNQVMRLTVLMEDLLLLGRPIQKEKMVDISIAKMIRDSLAAWQDGQQVPGDISLKISAEEDGEKCSRVLADSAKLEQVVVNLLDNAIQHSPGDTGIEIAVRRSDESTVVFSVKDSGEGIPEDIIPRKFEPFFTTRKGGTGLGLSIVRHIVESHGGTIVARNNESGAGAIFEVKLPIVTAMRTSSNATSGVP